MENGIDPTIDKATEQETQSAKDTLYYDSECPICSKEMAKLDRLKFNSLELAPIKDAELSDEERQAFYDNLHIKKANGDTLRGFDANIYVWGQTKYALIAKLFSVPPLVWIGRLGYRVWLTYYQYLRRKRLAKKN